MALDRRNLTGYSRSDSGGNTPPSSHANGMPNIKLSEIPKSFMRQIPWMIVALAVMFFASFWFTKNIKRQYVAGGRLFVQVGPEYVYDPATGSSQSGITITPDMVVLTEIDIIKNSNLIDKVIHTMINDPLVGGKQFAPKLYKKYEAARVKGAADEKDLWNNIVKMVEKSYEVTPKPKSSIVNLSYKHVDGDVAVKTLNAFMEAYLIFRKEKFVIGAGGDISERRMATEEQLREIEAKIQRILDRNDISEFGAEERGVQARAELLRTQLNTLRGRLAASEAALATTEDQLRTTPQTLDLYVEDQAGGRLAQAQLERRQLLAKYLPTSNPVRAKEVEISELRAQIDSYGGKANGRRRVGPNTVYQGLLTQRNTYQSQADSLREQESLLVQQTNGAIAKVKRLRQLGPTYDDLERQKRSLEQQVISLTTKEQESLVSQSQQDNSGQNITVITRPTFARKGRNMQKIMWALASAGSLFSVLMLALLRVFLDPKIYRLNSGAKTASKAAAMSAAYGAQPQPAPESIYAQPQGDTIPASVPEPAASQPMTDYEYAPAPIAEYAAPAEFEAAGHAEAPYSQAVYGEAMPVFESLAYDKKPLGQTPSEMGVYPDGTQAWDTNSQNAQTYADGSLAVSSSEPVLAAPAPLVPEAIIEAPQAYAPVPMQEYVGPAKDIPVLGQVTGAPDENPYAQ